MISPLAAFSPTYLSRASVRGVAPPVSRPAPEAAPAQAQAVAGSQEASAPPVTGSVRQLTRASVLLAVQESGKLKKSPLDLSEEEQKQVAELKKRDQEVRRHERAHSAAAGSYGGLPSYELQQGPDGKQYAIGGEVSIDVKPENDPAATIAKADIVIRAALAPADPSAQDHQVAAQARQLKAEAVAELNKEKEAEKSEKRQPLFTETAEATDAYARAQQTSPAAQVIQTINGIVNGVGPGISFNV